jgi:hypothetical protein
MNFETPVISAPPVTLRGALPGAAISRPEAVDRGSREECGGDFGLGQGGVARGHHQARVPQGPPDQLQVPAGAAVAGVAGLPKGVPNA